MKPEAAPVAQNPRQVPYLLQGPQKKWLAQGVNEDIFEKVLDAESVTWCSRILVQPKLKFWHTPNLADKSSSSEAIFKPQRTRNISFSTAKALLGPGLYLCLNSPTEIFCALVVQVSRCLPS